MKLEDTTIYPFIKSYPELCKLYKFSRNKYITRVVWNDEDVWYLVSGSVKVEATAQNGKKLLVDIVCEDNYVGHLSNFYGQNFYCDCVAMLSSTLIRIPAEMFRGLLNTQEFSRHFYMKTSARLYDMYKKELMRGLFTQRQQFAFYVIDKTKDGICRIHSIYYICEYLKISRRNLYNLLARFEEDGIMERLETGDIQVLDMEALFEIAKPVVDFCHNKI
ncbi:Crp/Fnr family transcriptional regulator [Clostridium sp. KNHs216]|uniref:Crp/Fnr family transcriptional regulator n=1 Tax=Clostridium sp. KNHs216 TaxID=1550235 RepID=UPI001150C446|nr:Crp/Fnr family transcriptional regulator [Clostridium sp. KNHs216]TQI67856.1 CRP-like cAMP-binding protein [Clostridium sp. KNHs216]